MAVATFLVLATIAQRRRAKAPAQYYTQNRMVNGEDYNIVPYTTYADIVKVKSVNRYSSGISRYLDIVDPTGKYSSTNLFADDGVLYKQSFTESFNFTYSSKTDIEGVIYNTLYDILDKNDLKNYYYSKFGNIYSNTSTYTWSAVTSDSNMTTGYIKSELTGSPARVGPFTANDLPILEPPETIKEPVEFVASVELVKYKSLALTPNPLGIINPFFIAAIY